MEAKDSDGQNQKDRKRSQQQRKHRQSSNKNERKSVWFGTLQDKEQEEDKSNGLHEDMDYRKLMSVIGI